MQPETTIPLSLFEHGRPLVTLKEAAAALAISAAQVSDLIDAGQLLAVPIGENPEPIRQHVRINRFSIEGFYAHRESEKAGIAAPYRLSYSAAWWKGQLEKRPDTHPPAKSAPGHHREPAKPRTS